MALHIDYYASLNSPWTHMGAARIEAMAGAHGASLRIYPVDFGEIFANSVCRCRNVHRNARPTGFRSWPVGATISASRSMSSRSTFPPAKP